jgi:hypothetical protein
MPGNRGGQPAYEAANGDTITVREAEAIAALMRLATRWPDTLTLIATGGSLCVVHTDDPRVSELDHPDRPEAVLAYISGIPNDT